MKEWPGASKTEKHAPNGRVKKIKFKLQYISQEKKT